VKIRAFRGHRYGIGRVADVSAVVAPPYDQISPAMQRQLHEMDPHNIVHLTLPLNMGAAQQADPQTPSHMGAAQQADPQTPSHMGAPQQADPQTPSQIGAPQHDDYARVRQVLDRWVAEGAWLPEEWPAIYAYHQTYTVGGTPITRMGVITLGEVTPYAAGEVLPHERTHAGPKRDRLALLEATGADIGLLFMLVGDPQRDLVRLINPGGAPTAVARDLRGEHHALWRITDTDVIAGVTRHLADRPVIIADGHHRYETAVDYATRNPAAREKLMAFFPLEGPGLTILPNHRLVHDVSAFDFDRFIAGAAAWFDVAPLPEPLAFRPDNRRIGVVAGEHAVTLRLRDDAFARIVWPEGTSAVWRALAVSILHEGLLRPLLDITDEKLDARTHVDYTADQEEAVRLALEGKYQAAFLIAATTPAELQAVVRGGELMPQKSTHFYPKLLDGLVFHRLGQAA
jgi:uncharacterized protein (DUF1015 family)